MPNQKTLTLLDKATHAVFLAEQAIRKEENSECVKPMFQIRLHIHDIVVQYCANLPISNYVPYSKVEDYLKEVKNGT